MTGQQKKNTAQPGKKPEKQVEKPKADALKETGAARWAGDKFAVAQARADKFFTTDDELPLSKHLLLVIIAVFFVVFVIWANFARLDEVTRGDGTVIPSSELQKLQSLEGGIVEEFMVRTGDSVDAGQPLIRLRDVQAASDLGASRRRYLGLRAKVERLRAEAESAASPSFSEEVMREAPESVSEEMDAFRANQRNFQSQTSVLQQQLVQRQQEVSGLQRRVSDLREVLRMSREERDMIAPLVERGSAPRVELLQLERGIQERQTELNSVMASLNQAQSAVNEANARLEELTNAAQAQAQTELAVTSIEMSSLRETLSGLEDRRVRTVIHSPVDGTVKDILVSTVGGVVRPGDDIIEIVPRDDQLIIEARIRPSDIAFIHPGQEAVIKITAYDYSIYGGLRGEVIDISADTLTNEQGETFYRIRIRTDETSLTRRGEVLEIIPGMVASIDILTGHKTVMEYLLKPLIKTLDNAMNER